MYETIYCVGPIGAIVILRDLYELAFNQGQDLTLRKKANDPSYLVPVEKAIYSTSITTLEYILSALQIFMPC